MKITGKRRAELRAEAHHLSSTVHVGQHGLTQSVTQALNDALRTHELVKVHLSAHVGVKPRDAATELASVVRADVVQVIGRTVTLYRENPKLERRKGASPPWRTI